MSTYDRPTTVIGNQQTQFHSSKQSHETIVIIPIPQMMMLRAKEAKEHAWCSTVICGGSKMGIQLFLISPNLSFRHCCLPWTTDLITFPKSYVISKPLCFKLPNLHETFLLNYVSVLSLLPHLNFSTPLSRTLNWKYCLNKTISTLSNLNFSMPQHAKIMAFGMSHIDFFRLH